MTALGGYGKRRRGCGLTPSSFRRASEPVVLSAAGAKDLFTRDRPAAPTASGPYGPPLTPRRLPKRGGTSRTGQALPTARAPTRQTRSRCSRRDPRVANRAGSRAGARRAPRTGTATRDSRRPHAGARAASRTRAHGRTARPGVRTAGPSRSPRPTRGASQERAGPGNRRARQGKKGDVLRRRRQSPKNDPRRTPTSSQLQLPGLGDEVLAEAVVLLLAHDAEARRLVQASSRAQLALGPQHDLAVARRAREANALIHEAGPE